MFKLQYIFFWRFGVWYIFQTKFKHVSTRSYNDSLISYIIHHIIICRSCYGDLTARIFVPPLKPPKFVHSLHHRHNKHILTLEPLSVLKFSLKTQLYTLLIVREPILSWKAFSPCKERYKIILRHSSPYNIYKTHKLHAVYKKWSKNRIIRVWRHKNVYLEVHFSIMAALSGR